ncbi:MAG: hypothetical protein WBL68_12505, partial [Nitrososphaeraceae archaeon]
GLSSSVFIWAIISLSSSTIPQESYLIIGVTHHNKYDVIIIYQISSFGVSAREAKLYRKPSRSERSTANKYWLLILLSLFLAVMERVMLL